MQAESPIKDRFITELGTDVGDEFYRLYLYWLEAWVEFKEYRKLFDDSDKATLLNAIGSQFFRKTLRTMQDSLILHITRLTDPPRTGRYRNLSLRILPQHLEEDKNIPNPERFRDPEWIAGLNHLLDTAEDNAAFARRHRNERIAHLDYDTVRGLNPEPLEALNIKEVRQIIDSIYQVIRYVYSGMYPDTDLLDSVSYQSWTDRFLVHEQLRVYFLVYLDTLIDPEKEFDTLSDELALTFYNRFNVDIQNFDYDTYWKHIHLFLDFRKEVKELREKGIQGSPSIWP